MQLFDEGVWDEDEDPAFIEAVQASLAEWQERSGPHPTSESVHSLLRSFQENLLTSADGNETVSVIISRKAIMQSTLRAIERKTFSFMKPVNVTFAGEEAVDAGGPRREYFRLLMASLAASAVFHGSWFSHDLYQLNQGKYALAGKLVAWSVLQGCNGPRCSSEVGYNLCRGVAVDPVIAIEAIADVGMKTILNAIEASTSEKEFADVLEKSADQIAGYGYSNIYIAKLANKDDIVHSLLKQHFVYGVHAEYAQFIEGMNTVGNFGNVVLANKSVFDNILSNKQEKLTAAKFKSLYELNTSEQGSNSRQQEESTIYCFEVFLKDLEEGERDGLALEDLLVFITGSDTVPPLGFDHVITVEFYDVTGNDRRRPWSSTCGFTFHLPRGIEEPQEFNALMKEALLGCHGFGKS